MKTTTKGLIIKEQTIGESDRLVTLLTADYGLIKAFVRSAKRIKNQNISSTSLFSYSEFSIYKGKDAYIINSAEPIEMFFDLRKDIERLALAQYFAQLVYELGSEEQQSEEMLRLILNALHLLCKGKDLKKIKSVVEMRMCCLGGYMPSILACFECGEYETDVMYFDIEKGVIFCSNCAKGNALVQTPLGVITAIRFICLTDIKKVFSFNINEENFNILSSLTEKYLVSRVNRRLGTLEFYKGLF